MGPQNGFFRWETHYTVGVCFKDHSLYVRSLKLRVGVKVKGREYDVDETTPFVRSGGGQRGGEERVFTTISGGNLRYSATSTGPALLSQCSLLVTSHHHHHRWHQVLTTVNKITWSRVITASSYLPSYLSKSILFFSLQNTVPKLRLYAPYWTAFTKNYQ